MSFKPAAALVLILAGFQLMACAPVRAEGQALSPRFTVARDGGYPFCSQFAAFLNSLKDMPLYYREVPIPPDEQRFRHPAWQQADISENKAVIGRLFAFQKARSTDPRSVGAVEADMKPQLDGLIREDIERHHARLERAVFDFDNDGADEEVYRYFSDAPPYQRKGGWRYYIPSLFGANAYFGHLGGSYDVILFGGQTFVWGFGIVLWPKSLSPSGFHGDVYMRDLCSVADDAQWQERLRELEKRQEQQR